jgi:DNA-binding NtrC family response regulator
VVPVAVVPERGALFDAAKDGSSMSAQYPAASETSPRDIPERARKFPVQHILVVDDERLVRWAIAETLGDRGYDVLEAGDAASARRAMQSADATPDLVLLDLWLPDSDDLGLASQLRAQAPDTAIVLMTAYGTPEIFTQAAELGIATVNKPFDMNELASIVDRTLAPHAA